MPTTMTWPGTYGDPNTTKSYITEEDGSGNAVYTGKAPTPNASEYDDGWLIRRNQFNASDEVIAYQEFLGIWANRASYRFGPTITLTISPIQVTGQVNTNSKQIKSAHVNTRLEVVSVVRPMPINFRSPLGRVAIRAYITGSKNWSTVVTKVRKIEGVCIALGKGVTGNIKIRRTLAQVRVNAVVSGELVD